MQIIIPTSFATVMLAAAISLFLLPGRHNLRKKLTDRYAILAAILMLFATGIAVHLPLYAADPESGGSFLAAFVLSVHHTLRLFVLDGEMTVAFEYGNTLSSGLRGWYLTVATLTYVTCPILTFRAVLSVVTDVSADWALFTHRNAEKYVFSEVDTRAVALAHSIREKEPQATIVFTNGGLRDSETDEELRRQVREMGAILYRNDICTLPLKQSCKTTIFLISEDENENVRKALHLMRQYGNAQLFVLYVFSCDPASELLFQKCETPGMRVRRVNETKTLVHSILFTAGYHLFEDAVCPPQEKGDKLISAVILGLGDHGMQFLKDLTWFGQMEGYELRITAFDKEQGKTEHLMAQCPEMMSPQINGKKVPGEAQYTLNVYDETDVFSTRYQQIVENLPAVTYAFISLGEDSRNIQAAVGLREMCERNGWKPYIQAAASGSEQANSLEGISNFRGTKYDIHFIGGTDQLYSCDCIIRSELEQLALKRHLLWGEEEDFWRYEYNHDSSVASALHKQVKLMCHVPGAELPIAERTEEQREMLRVTEHRRWNAYMRSIGYRYSGSRDKSTRNDLAKLHHDLVPYGVLSEADRAKDDVE